MKSRPKTIDFGMVEVSIVDVKKIPCVKLFSHLFPLFVFNCLYSSSNLECSHYCSLFAIWLSTRILILIKRLCQSQQIDSQDTTHTHTKHSKCRSSIKKTSNRDLNVKLHGNKKANEPHRQCKIILKRKEKSKKRRKKLNLFFNRFSFFFDQQCYIFATQSVSSVHVFVCV